jgi:pyruvate/2-oxoglutarate dehydrogenase complex dihydrolipoamide acyltransferase (E2) component
VAASGTPEVTEVTMPQMGVSVSEGTVVSWRKQVGDWVAYDEPLCEISTDKIDTEVPAPAAGRVTELAVGLGETVEVGMVLARIETGARPGEAHEAEQDGDRPPSDAAQAPSDAAQPSDPAKAPSDAAQHYSPVVLRIAQEHGIDLAQVQGSGRGGRVRKQDVLAVVEAGGATGTASEPPAGARLPGEPPAGEPLSRMRQLIGLQMRHALDTAAHCTTIVECDMSRVERRRRALGITALPLVARATVEALREFPSLNATLDGEQLTRHADVNLGIAVSLDEEGLVVPVVPRAQELSAEGLAARIKDLATRARTGRLQPDEVQDGTFTITNPGAFGAIAATPIVNVPQVAILDLEAIVKRPVVVTGEDGSDAIAIRPMANLCMSWDHRALDGAYAARFLTALRSRLEAL